MKMKSLVQGSMLVVATAAVTATVMSQEYDKQQEMPPEVQQMLEMGAPGEQHKDLAKYVGEWTSTVKHYQSPGAAPEESTTTSTFEMLMDGRYLLARHEGDMMGMPFTGSELMGYDKMRGEYFSIWIDNFGTGYMLQRGKKNEKGQLVMKGTYDDPMTGTRDKPYRSVSEDLGPDKAVYKMYMEGPDGNEMLALEVTSERK